jgi:hypothetical protein
MKLKNLNLRLKTISLSTIALFRSLFIKCLKIIERKNGSDSFVLREVILHLLLGSKTRKLSLISNMMDCKL